MWDPSIMLKSYVVVGWGGGPWDFSVSPRPLGFGFLGFGPGLDNKDLDCVSSSPFYVSYGELIWDWHLVSGNHVAAAQCPQSVQLISDDLSYLRVARPDWSCHRHRVSWHLSVELNVSQRWEFKWKVAFWLVSSLQSAWCRILSLYFLSFPLSTVSWPPP